MYFKIYQEIATINNSQSVKFSNLLTLSHAQGIECDEKANLHVPAINCVLNTV